MITVSTGQCIFEGASRAEHVERQSIYIERLGASVRRCYRRHEVVIEEWGDDGRLSVTVSHPWLSTDEQIERLVSAEKIDEHVRHLSDEAWEYACKARLYRVGGHGGTGREITEVFRTAPAAVDAAKRALGYGARRVGVARSFGDGQIGVYLDRSEMRRDATGAHARYTITVL